MNNYRKISLFAMLLVVLTTWAQPNGTGTYYQPANGKKGKSLKTALWGIIKNPKVVSYDGLWAAYKKTDLRPDGKIWDMYSNKTNYDPDKGHAGNYSKEGDMYNREHSFPKSWFSEGKPMYSDIVHVVPCDGYVNNRRSNMPFGENNGETYKSAGGFSKVGSCTVKGYSDKCFEPADEYKGDFARIYFYMATCYEDKISSWKCDMLSGNSYPAYKQWVIDMLLRWAKEDPVSQKEIDRNKGIEEVQGNRNPYVDYPGLEQYVWGNKTDVPFSYDNYDSTITPDPTPDTPDTPEQPDQPDQPETPDTPDTPTPTPTPSEGEQTYELVNTAEKLTADSYYLLVSESGNNSVALSDLMSTGKAYSYVSVTIINDTIVTKVNEDEKPHELYISGSTDNYTIYDVKTQQYLSLPSSDNALKTSDKVTGETEKWSITISSDGSADIENNKYSERSIRYNPSNPRFACYKSGLQPVQLYRRTITAGIGNISANVAKEVVVYSIDGRKIMKLANGDNPADRLAKGLYIIGGRKVAVGGRQ